MSEIVTDYDFTAPSPITTSARQSYDWDNWMDGKIHRLIQGVDFLTHPLMMERIIRTRATDKKYKVRMRHEPLVGNIEGVERMFAGGNIVFQRVDVEPPKPKRPSRAEARARKAEKAVAAAKPVKATSKKATKPVAVAARSAKKAAAPKPSSKKASK